jgi:hypothetical protein
MSTPKPVAPGVAAPTLAKWCLGVIPECRYVAGLRLGKVLKRREARERRIEVDLLRTEPVKA